MVVPPKNIKWDFLRLRINTSDLSWYDFSLLLCDYYGNFSLRTESLCHNYSWCNRQLYFWEARAASYLELLNAYISISVTIITAVMHIHYLDSWRHRVRVKPVKIHNAFPFPFFMEALSCAQL